MSIVIKIKCYQNVYIKTLYFFYIIIDYYCYYFGTNYFFFVQLFFNYYYEREFELKLKEKYFSTFVDNH